MHALSLEPHAQQIHFGKFSLVEPGFVVGDNLAEVVAVFLIELGEKLGPLCCPVGLSYAKSYLKTNLLGAQPASFEPLCCSGNSAGSPSGSFQRLGRIGEGFGVLPKIEVRTAQIF